MTPGEAVSQAKKDAKLLPVYLVAGEERLLRDEVIGALRDASLAGGVAAFNEDRFTAGEVNVDTVIAAARTVPMMARRRFVLVRGAERWDAKEAETSPFDRLAEYAASPVDSTCVVITASKIDGRRKLALAARKQGFLVVCDPLDDRALPRWIIDRFAAKGHAIDREHAELLAALAGPGLSAVDDAIERLSLYVGPREAPIDEGKPSPANAWPACGPRTRGLLVDAVGARDLGRAMRTLADAYDPRERGLPLLGALAWSMRQLARYQAALEAGASPDEAAPKRASASFNPAARATLAARKAARAAREGGRTLDTGPRRDRPGAEELAPAARRGARRDAHAALPRRNARCQGCIEERVTGRGRPI